MAVHLGMDQSNCGRVIRASLSDLQRGKREPCLRTLQLPAQGLPRVTRARSHARSGATGPQEGVAWCEMAGAELIRLAAATFVTFTPP